METQAVIQAKRRLAKIEGAHARLLNAEASISETREAWSDFLIATAGLYAKLEAGAKSSGRSSAWFGRVIKERKDDELLKYLHHARNAEEHGIREVTDDKGRSVMHQMPDGTYAGTITSDRDGGLSIGSARIFVIDEAGNEIEVDLASAPTITRDFATLIAVSNGRDGGTVPVPTKHWGADYMFMWPVNASATAMPYLRGLVAIAEALI